MGSPHPSPLRTQQQKKLIQSVQNNFPFPHKIAPTEWEGQNSRRRGRGAACHWTIIEGKKAKHGTWHTVAENFRQKPASIVPGSYLIGEYEYLRFEVGKIALATL